MQIIDTGIFLCAKKFSPTAFVVHFFSKENGVFSGAIKARDFSSKKVKSSFASGNFFDLRWVARLENQLGQFDVDLVQDNSRYFLFDNFKLNFVSYISFLLKNCLAEKHKYEKIFDNTYSLLDGLNESDDKVKMLYGLFLWEIDFLKELGFGLDLSVCVASGMTENLYYVSPKSGKVVSRIAGEPYKDKLFVLPEFIRENKQLSSFCESNALSQVFDALKITAYFIDKHLTEHLDEKRFNACKSLRKSLLVF